MKSLQPEISKDVSISGVYSEEQAIFRAQQLELIYSQYGILQKYLPDAPGSKVDIAKSKPGPHGEGIIGSVDTNAVNLLSQLQQLSLQTASNNQVTSSTTSSSKPSLINVIQSNNPKGNQNSNGKKKGRGKKKNQDGKADTNKSGNNAGGGRNESKKKVKFPCKLCSGDHLTHLYPKIQDAHRLLGQQGASSSQAVLTNPFPQGQQLLAGASSNLGTSSGGSQEGEKSSKVFMMGSNVHVATRSRDYGEAKTSKEKTAPRNTNLHIERPLIETIPRIPKGSAKRVTINPNTRAA